MTDQEYKTLAISEHRKLKDAKIQLENATDHYVRVANNTKKVENENKIKLGPTYEEALLEAREVGWDLTEKSESYRVYEDDHVTWRFPYEKGYIKVDYQMIDGKIRIQTRYICPPPWELQ